MRGSAAAAVDELHRVEGSSAEVPIGAAPPRSRVEGSGATVAVDDVPLRRRVESLAADARATWALPPGVEGSGVESISDSARPKAEGAAARPGLVGHLRVAAGAKLVLASAVATLFGALYLESRNDLYLGAASTALALIAFWLAEHELGRSGGR
jgi:hypothetical protein